MVYPARFERATSASGGLRSIQLSYGYAPFFYLFFLSDSSEIRVN